MEYDIQFICCSCKITEIERKHIMRKHRKKNICMTAWNPLPVGVFSIVFCIASYSIFFSPAAWQSSGPNRWFIFYVSIFCMVTETTTLYLLHHEFQRLCSILTVICQSAYSITSIRSIIKLVTKLLFDSKFNMMKRLQNSVLLPHK